MKSKERRKGEGKSNNIYDTDIKDLTVRGREMQQDQADINTGQVDVSSS